MLMLMVMLMVMVVLIHCTDEAMGFLVNAILEVAKDNQPVAPAEQFVRLDAKDNKKAQKCCA